MGRRCALWVAVGLVLTMLGVAPAMAGLRLRPPVPGSVTREFAVGSTNWEAGHRGVDLGGRPGEAVVAAADGRVSFAGPIAGRPVVSVSHGVLRTTYEPVVPAVAAGTAVAAGDVIGYLHAGHEGCPVTACLHWGLTDGTTYQNPLDFVGAVDVRLLPLGATPAPAPPRSIVSDREFVWPAQGRPGSPFGLRVHPILGYVRMHWGTDIGASCGSPLLAVADGVVVERAFSGGHGNHLVLDVGTRAGAATRVGYSHAERYVVSVGQRVTKGQVVGYVGTTGLSTGCHLHLEMWRDGTHVDPMVWVHP